MTWKCPKCGRLFSRRNQSHYCVKPQTVDEYIESQIVTVQPKLKELRMILRQALPDAEECISWSMPTYREGNNLIHFSAAKNHIGIYPGEEAAAEFADELKAYDVSKGTIRIPYDCELPADLLADIARWCRLKYAGNNSVGK